MRLFFTLILSLLFSSIHQSAYAQGCFNNNQHGQGFTTVSGYYRQAKTDCAVASDVNGHHTQGRNFVPNAGSRFGMPPLKDNKDAADFVKKCLAEKGVYSDENGTLSRDPNFESALAQCNGELYGEQFIVKRFPFATSRDKLTNTHVNVLNSALQSDGCIAIGEYKIYSFDPHTGFNLEGHAVELTGAKYENNEYTLEFADPNDPESTTTMTTNYSNKGVDMKISDDYRTMMGYRPETWIKLSAIVLKCPADRTCAIDSMISLDEETTLSCSNRKLTPVALPGLIENS